MPHTKPDKRLSINATEVQTPLSSFKDETGLNETMALLGIPASERTSAVRMAISALLEKLEDLTQEVNRANDQFSELEKLVDVDCVAPVPNRRAFMRRLTWAISMFKRYNHPCSIIYFDLNGFKKINDEFGHAAGDMAIRHISEILTKSLRASDYMARLSGDEFAILMYYANERVAGERGKDIAAKILAMPMLWNQKRLSITAAFGAYEVQKADDPETALSHADAAMYRHKRTFKEQGSDLPA